VPALLQVPRVLADKVKSYYDYVVEREVQADEAGECVLQFTQMFANPGHLCYNLCMPHSSAALADADVRSHAYRTQSMTHAM